jgi:dipeptidyl-peptidase-4
VAPSAGESVFFDSTEGSPLQSNLWTMRLDGTGKRRVTSGQGVHETMLSPDGSFFSDQVSTLATPPEVKVCATGATGAAIAAAPGCKPIWSSQSLGPVAGVKMSFVTLRAADGVTTLYGTLTQPAPSATAGGTKTVPVIVNPYGGPLPSAGVRDAWDGLAGEFSELLAQHGFAVLTVDNRGSGGRGREFQQADYHNFGAVQLADQLAALDQVLAANPEFDPQRVGWWGWSWGGTFTLYAMTHTSRIRAGVAVAPVTDFRNYDSIYTERYLGLPAANPAVYDAASVTAAAGNLRGRVLIAQGTGDDNVHLANTIQFVQPLIDAGIPYDLQVFPRLTHSIAGLNARNQLFNRILWQFETYLMSAPNPE